MPAKPSNVGTSSTKSCSQPLRPRVTVRFYVFCLQVLKHFMSFCVVLCRFVSLCGKWLCGILYLCKREQEEQSWVDLRRVHVQHSFSARSALVKVWKTTSDHRVLNVHNSNKPHESILQLTKTLNATNNENYGKCKQLLSDARTIRKILLLQGHLPQDEPNSRQVFFHEAFLGLRYYRTTLLANDKQQSCADKLQRKQAGNACAFLPSG